MTTTVNQELGVSGGHVVIGFRVSTTACELVAAATAGVGTARVRSGCYRVGRNRRTCVAGLGAVSRWSSAGSISDSLVSELHRNLLEPTRFYSACDVGLWTAPAPLACTHAPMSAGKALMIPTAKIAGGLPRTVARISGTPITCVSHRPLTRTGVDELAVVPFPSCP